MLLNFRDKHLWNELYQYMETLDVRIKKNKFDSYVEH